MRVGVYFNRNIFKRVEGGETISELRYLVQEAIPEKTEIFIFHPDCIDWWDKSINGLAYDSDKKRWIPANFKFPDAIYDRATFPKKDKEIGHAARKRLMEEHHIIFLNSKHYFNKWQTHRILYIWPELRRYLPDTEIYGHPIVLEKYLNKYKYVYVKDSAGKLGRNIFKIQQGINGQYIVIHQSKGKICIDRIKADKLNDKITNGVLAGKTLVIQQGIELARLNGKPFDIRILAQKNGCGRWEIVDKSVRVAAGKDCIVTNISEGGEAKRFVDVIPVVFPGIETVIDEEMKVMAIKICSCLEEKYGRLGELGIDAAVDEQGKIWLLEVNGKPAKSCIHNLNNPELIHLAYSNIIKYLKYLMSAETPNKDLQN